MKSKYHITSPAISFEKKLLLKQLRKRIGLSAYEVSFMLGKHDFFIRDTENPLNMTCIESEDIDHLVELFRISTDQITPPNVHIDEYQLEVIKDKTETNKDRFEIHFRNVPGTHKPIIHVEEGKLVELDTALRLSDESTVREFIDELYCSGFLNHTRTALEIFNECRKKDHFGADFHPRYMIKVLQKYSNNKSGEPTLDGSRTNQFSRQLFFKPIDFQIEISKGQLSRKFKDWGICTFQKAAMWVNELPYRRNNDKENEFVLFDERIGTCSTKHALLKRLVDENNHQELRLILGIFKMNAENTPPLKSLLKKYNLDYVPEAHNYLRAYNYILDFTGIGLNETKFELDLLEEVHLQPDQIMDFKISYHKSYLATWLQENKIPYTLDELWKIREECIRAISLSRLEIETERLLLRPFKKEDAATIFALNDDEEVLQYTGDVQFTDVAAAEYFLEKYEQYEKYGVGRLLVILKESSEILGWCGLKYHSESEEYDIGYRLFKKYWGKGYATESAKAVMKYGFERLQIKRVVGRSRVENNASIRVFEKLNLKFVNNFIEDEQNWVLYQATSS